MAPERSSRSNTDRSLPGWVTGKFQIFSGERRMILKFVVTRAKAGLLDEVVSTTFPSDIDKMREMFPTLDIRKDVLFVHDGKYITSAGGAKSFEAALYLAEVLYGAPIARRLAQGLVIDWDLREVPHLVIEDKVSMD